jgi:hypothetical protein
LNREDNLHHIARREFEQVLDRTIGQEWRLLREVEDDQPTIISDMENSNPIIRQQSEIDL